MKAIKIIDIERLVEILTGSVNIYSYIMEVGK